MAKISVKTLYAKTIKTATTANVKIQNRTFNFFLK